MRVDVARVGRSVRVWGRAVLGVSGSLALFGCGSSTAGAPTTAAITVVTTAGAPRTDATSVEAGLPSTTAASEVSGSYTVAAGDALVLIAKRHCATLDELVATNGWSDGSSHPLYPGDVIKLPVVPCNSTPPSSSEESDTTAVATTPASSGEVADDINGPEYNMLMDVVYWDYSDAGEYEGQYSDPTCTAAYSANFDIERGQSDDVDAAIAGLESLSIPIPDDLPGYMSRKAAIFHTYANDLRRIQDTYYRDGPDAAQADPAYATVAAALVELRSAPSDMVGTSLIRPVCEQFQLSG